MPTKKRDTEKKPALINVTRAPSDANDPWTRLELSIQFDTARIGKRRAKRVWQGIAMIVNGVLEPEEQREFLDQMDDIQVEIAKEKLAAEKSRP